MPHHSHVTAGIVKLTHIERDPRTSHPCTTTPSTRHSRCSASIVVSAERSPASPPGPTILVERLLRIEISKILIDLLLQSTSCCSLLFAPQLLPSGGPLACCLFPRGEALLSLSRPGGGISSPTRRKRAEMEEGKRVDEVTWCVCACVYLLNYT